MRRTSITAALLGLALSPAAMGEETISAGFGGGNGICGNWQPSASIAYDRDSDDLAAHTYLTVGPNGSCDGQGISIDAAVTKMFQYRGPWSGFVEAGYDRRTIAFEYGVKSFRGYDVEAASAIAGIRYDCGDECSIRLGYNAVKTPKVRVADGADPYPDGNASRIFLAANYEFVDEWEVSADTNFTVSTVRLGRTGAFIDLAASVTFGAHKLEHPAPGSVAALDDGGSPIVGQYLARRDAPSPIYSIHVGWRF